MFNESGCGDAVCENKVTGTLITVFYIPVIIIVIACMNVMHESALVVD